MNRHTHLPSLPKVHFRKSSNEAICKFKRPVLLEDRVEKVDCKKCLEAIKKMSDFNFCQNCQKTVGVIDKFYCASCGEMMCAFCGCTNSEPCWDVCEWTRDGVCSSCADNGDE